MATMDTGNRLSWVVVFHTLEEIITLKTLWATDLLKLTFACDLVMTLGEPTHPVLAI